MGDPHLSPPAGSQQAQRLRAVLALFQGQPAAAICRQYRLCRSDLYNCRQRALPAIQQALADRRRGPRRPHNRLAAAREHAVVALCHDRPTWSSYTLQRRGGPSMPSPRTIQRVRKRHGLARLPKRAPAVLPDRRLDPVTRSRAKAIMQEKPSLGPERLAWDLQNGEHVLVSPATMKRLQRQHHRALLPPRPPPPAWRFYERHHPHSLWHGDFLEKVTLTDRAQTAYQLTLLDDYSRGYVFCDLFLNPDIRTTIRALIAALRQWRVIPRAVVFDNGAPFKGKLLSAFCTNLNIRLIHAAVAHPQTNGKLERAFRDDMRDFYRQYDAWRLDPLRHDLPAYVHYRNHVRGHHALGGKPAITRLKEQTHMALPDVLARLESSACYEVGRKLIPATGTLRLFGRDASLGTAWAGVAMTFCESLEGLEARLNGQCVAVLRDDRTFKQRACYDKPRLPPTFHFEPAAPVSCP
jgi:transposase InsO family protein